MSRYLADTSALIDYSKGHEPVRSRLQGLIDAGDEVAVCAVNVTEFYSGLPPTSYPIWNLFFAALPYWPISRNAAIRAGQFRYAYARQGQPLSTMDSLVAAVAEERGATIITRNVKDFPMPEVSVISLAT